MLVYFILSVLSLGAVFSGLVTQFADFSLMSCADLPSVEEANKIIDQNKEVFDKVQELSRGFVSVDMHTCTGKAHILIQYETLENRKSIKNLIGDTFFGIPYSMQ